MPLLAQLCPHARIGGYLLFGAQMLHLLHYSVNQTYS